MYVKPSQSHDAEHLAVPLRREGAENRADRLAGVGSFLLSPHSMQIGGAIERPPFFFPTSARAFPRSGQSQTHRADFRADGRGWLCRRIGEHHRV